MTYVIDGAFQNQETTGSGGLITDGATQWMTDDLARKPRPSGRG